MRAKRAELWRWTAAEAVVWRSGWRAAASLRKARRISAGLALVGRPSRRQARDRSSSIGRGSVTRDRGGGEGSDSDEARKRSLKGADRGPPAETGPEEDQDDE